MYQCPRRLIDRSLSNLRCLRRFLLMLLILVPAFGANADDIELDFNSLPSAQSPAGLDWPFSGSGGTTENQVFSVGTNANNEPTLFQNSLGTISGQSYRIAGALDPAKTHVTIDVRAAVRQEQFFSNHFGFSFFIELAGVNLNVAIGQSIIQVNEITGFRTLASGLDNTDYHDYRLIGTMVLGGGWELYRDTTLVGSGFFQATPPENPPNELHLGDGSGGGNAIAEVLQYRVIQAGTCDNAAPVANAGPDQSVRTGDNVILDGSGSFDDNTAVESLIYSWELFVPPGSNAQLSDTNVISPTFVVDVLGGYSVELTVVDEGGLISEPDDVVISSDNLAPTAHAGINQIVIVGTNVQLDGSGSSDPENDPLTFEWTFEEAPPGSNSDLTGADSEFPAFAPDVLGRYEVRLIVSDAIGASEPDLVDVIATTATTFAEIKIHEASDIVSVLTPPGEVKNTGNRTALLNFFGQALLALQEGDIDKAIEKLNKSILRTDGCILREDVDGNGPGRDWIIECSVQAVVYSLLNDALSAINP